MLRAIRQEQTRRATEREREELARNAEAIRLRCDSLAGFVKEAWPVLHPETEYIHGWHIDAICEHLAAISDGRISRLLINVPPGTMKALDDNTPVFTTWGWKRHGDLQPGDFVFGPDGHPKRVVAVTESKTEEAFEVVFDDSAKLVAGGGHLWEVERDVMSVAPRYTRGRKTVVVPTPELRSTGHRDGERERRPDRIPLTAAVAMPPKRLLIDPYLLGVWLGDGASESGAVYAAHQDIEHFVTLGRIGTTYEPAGTRRQTFYRITVEGLAQQLRFIKVFGNKHIPEDYLEASIEQRWALLQGLMDTDGHCDTSGTCHLSTKLQHMALAIRRLACSLGLKATVTSHIAKLNSVEHGVHYLVSFTPPLGATVFRLARKQARVRGNQNARSRNRYVTSVTPIGNRSVKCIQVEGGKYLAGHEFVSTHNSLLVSVFWPAWEWTKKPSLQYLTTSYSEGYVKRDSRRMRDLVASEWYQLLWGDRVRLGRTAEISFENTVKGFREGKPFASLTGGRGDRVIIDDPHSTETAESDADRATAMRIFRESVPTRLNDPKTSAIVVIMQRLHEADISGQILKLALGYDYLMLPMEFDPERRCHTSIGFIDPRTYDGELLFPERFPKEVVERDKRSMTQYAVAGQFQQRPAPREGGMFKRSWFDVVGAAPAGCRWVRHWDLASTQKRQGNNPDFTAGVKLGRAPDGTFYIADVKRCREEGPEVRRLIKQTAVTDGREVEISLPQDPGQAGKTQSRDMIGMLAGWTVRAEGETGSKEIRAEPVAAQAAVGNVKLVSTNRDDPTKPAPWIEPFLDEVTMFPASGHDDQVDALSGAFARLTLHRPATTTTSSMRGLH